MRYYIEQLLLDGPLDLETLAKRLQVSRDEMSAELASLQEEGFIYLRSDNRWSLYSPHWKDAILEKITRRDIFIDDVDDVLRSPKSLKQLVRYVVVGGRKYARYQYVGMTQGSRLIQVFIDHPQFSREAPSVGVSAYNAEEQEKKWYKRRNRGKP
ncbi:hypothetical protein [Meiothermus sp.]|uniref:hypothetical protein n=1 Tax=Meiothermus sp. TaxID=1955249 RepID=UPI0021DC8D20|nr:hypothetical protein [Meiothermus sp.]GIW25764.1 MAG: hypothetical protein KatS3mg069_2031 [Meiothermus sp.]